MSKQLEDILERFSELSPEIRLARIEKIRDTRTIERPAVARRRRKKEKVKSLKAKDKIKALMRKMSDSEKAEFLKSFKESQESDSND